ncbi:MAG: FKBP-type peptidyl-prolyl cis-trans isomerase [Bryobacteraceae bacterium]|nr:FKBP-type peptidyl-prolyl cis-trans isomerase [Bryobacteraceae bacterium]
MLRCLPLLLVLLPGCSRYVMPKAVPAVKGAVKPQYTMRYVDVAAGTGKLAEPGKVFVVHYTGWLRDGTKFDSSRDRNQPFEFEQGKRRVIPGWDAGFEGMRVGAKRRFMIPYQLAYGEKGRGKIPPKAELIFDVELLDVKEPQPEAKK